ncbi:MAG: hypothetical protein DMG88_08005 [Acidobacteria bacterium]|nr:MAG: hypothetical protein DMG88_08005 [Acidobacteriota bacterium]
MPSFYEDMIKNDARFNSVSRVGDPNLIEPVTRSAIANILDDARALGIELMIFETYRSQARQQELFNQGASKLRVVGVHHYGLACDLVKVVAGEPSWKGDFSFLGKLAHDHRLIWGGDWGDPSVPHTFIDAVHVQRCAVSLQPALFRGSFYPDAQYDPYAAAARATIAV